MVLLTHENVTEVHMRPVHLMLQHMYLLLGSLFVLEEQIYKGQF